MQWSKNLQAIEMKLILYLLWSFLFSSSVLYTEKFLAVYFQES